VSLWGEAPCARAAASDVVFPAAGRIGLTPPQGFAPLAQFPVFTDESAERSIELMELPETAYAQLPRAELIRRMPDRGMTFAGDCAAKDLPLEHRCVRATQTISGREVSKWMVLFRADGLAGLVTLTIPMAEADARADAAPPEFAALSSIAVRTPTDADRLAILPFTFEAPDVLSLIDTSVGAAALYEHPDRPPRSLPRLIIAASPKPTAPSSTVAWGRSAMMRLTKVEIDRFETETAISRAGMTGSEIIAVGTYRDTGAAVIVYQVVLADSERRFLRAVGIADAAERARFLEVFRKTALSMRRR